MFVTGNSVHIATSSCWIVYDLETGGLMERTPLATPGHPDLGRSIHPDPGRVAWAYSISLAAEPVSLVGWCDRSGEAAAVMVPDSSPYSGDARVLEDGRILARFDSLWVVDPHDRGVRFLAPASAIGGRPGDYHPRLVVDRSPAGRNRVWSTDPRAPLFVHFD